MADITVGLVMPATNTTLEPELRAWFPCPIRLSVQRITRPKGVLRPQDLPEERERVAAAGQALRAQKPDVVVMGCTAAGFLAGPAGDRDFCSDLQQITGVPTVSAAGSMLAALRSSQAQSVSVLTPYGQLVNDALRAFLDQSGLRIAAFQRIEVADIHELLAIDERRVSENARLAAQAPSDAIFVACSQLPTHGVLGSLSREAGRPAWSSVKAAAWNACAALGLPLRSEP
jgi:maleate cis-trans isomerase